METVMYLVSASGYKNHLCTSEEQASIVVDDIRMRKPEANCKITVSDTKMLRYNDNVSQLVLSQTYQIINLESIDFGFIIADFMALVQALNFSIINQIDGLVYLSSTKYVSVLKLEQAEELAYFLYDNYDDFKLKENRFFELNAEAFDEINSENNIVSDGKKIAFSIN